MSDPIDIQSHKNRKKYEQIVSDITAINHVLDLTQRSLVYFKKYKNVQEIISIIESNITLLNIHKKKYLDELEKAKK